MRKFIIGMTVVFLSSAVLALPQPFLDASEASGFGSMTAGPHGHGRGMLDFEVTASDDVYTGRLEFAAEIRDGNRTSLYPDYLVKLDTVDSVKFRKQSIEFSGKGRFNTDDIEWMDVEVHVRAIDGEARGKADRFEITCYGDLGEIVFQTQGELFTGDISINR